MALFFSAEAKEQPGPVAEMERMRGELQAVKDAARIRARHGQHIKDDQVSVYLADEKDMDRRRAESKEAARINLKNEADLDVAYRKLAVKLVHDKKMIVSLDGTRLSTIEENLLILCPHCSKPLGELSERVYQFAKIWHWAAASSIVDAFTVYSARSPLTEQGVRGHIQHNCIYCRKPIRAVIQMVVI